MTKMIMGKFRTRISTTAMIASILLLVEVLSQMSIEVEVMQFSNPNSKLKSGKCCNGLEGSRGRCPLMCQTFFTACAYGQEGQSCQGVHYALLQSQIMGNSTFSSQSSSLLSTNDLDPKTSKKTSKFILVGTATQSIQTGLMLDLEAWNKKKGASFSNSSLIVADSSLIAEFTLNVGTVGELMNQWGTPVSTEVRYPDTGPIFIKARVRLTCAAGYYGPTCSKHCIDRLPFKCDQTGNYVCAPGYTGDMCDRFVCEKPCVNGSCNGPNICSCNFGFRGNLCDQCIPLQGCVNGKCYKNNPHTCACHTGWGGSNCDQDLEVCARLKPCQNGGDCRPDPESEGGQGYRCKCQKGFSGISCEVSATCDSPGYCENGATCSGPSSVVCKCPFGWKGTRCNERIPCDSQTMPCRNGGSCEKSITSSVFRCQCGHGFLGHYCELEDPCVKASKTNRSICLTGVCNSDANGSFKCLCDSNHFGQYCEKRISDIDCDPNPCHNRGKCIKHRGGEMKCECSKEFSGKFCTEKKNPCSDHPCNNGATCIDRGEGAYECRCPNGFYGKTCNKKMPKLVEEETEILSITTSTSITDITTVVFMQEEINDDPTEQNSLLDHKISPKSLEVAAKENIDVNLAVNIPQNSSNATSLNIIAFVLVSLALAAVIFLVYHFFKKFRNGYEILPTFCVRKDPTSHLHPHTGNIHQNNIGGAASNHSPSYRRGSQSDDLEIEYKQKELNKLLLKGGHQKNENNRNFKCNNLNRNVETSAQNMYYNNRNSVIPDKWVLTKARSPPAQHIFDKHFSDEQINKVPKTKSTEVTKPDKNVKLEHELHSMENHQRRNNFISRSLDSVSQISSNKDYKTTKM